MKAFAVGLGLPDNYFDEKFAEPTLALLHYPPHPADTDSWGVGPHTDYGMCTLLLQDDIGGLEVEVTEGQWIEAKPIPGSSDIRKDGIFSMSRAWDKEKIWVPDGNRTHDLPYTGRTL